MKKILASFLALMIAMSVLLTAFASMPNRIYADEVTVEGGETVTIPVKIENNEGFMGFSVSVTYDEDVFTPVSATKGTIVSGLFNDSISTSKNNSFKVVCSETDNVTENGILFNLKFDVADDVSGKYKIGLSYSQQDTFDENWNDVTFTCEDIEVVITENGTTAPVTTPATEPSTEPETEPTTEPATNPVDDPVDDKPLSVRMNEWVDSLPMPFNIILGIFVSPIAFIISIFE